MTILPRNFCSKCGLELGPHFDQHQVSLLNQERLCIFCKEEEEQIKKTMETPTFKELEKRLEMFAEFQEKIATKMIIEGEVFQKVLLFTGIGEAQLKKLYEKISPLVGAGRITESVGTVHDIYAFSFEGDIEEYLINKWGDKNIDVKLIQDSRNLGLFQIKVTSASNKEKIIEHEESLNIVKEIYKRNIDEVYINFASHIVYLIELYK